MFDLRIENINFYSISSNKFVNMLDSNNIIVSNCNFTSGPNRTKGGPLDLYRNNKNILIENCYFETHASGSGGIWIRQGSSSGISENIEFNNCIFIGDSVDETIAIWGWKGTIQNVKIVNSSITRPLNQNVSNAFSITIGQSGITKNCGFDNCTFDIYQANAGVFHCNHDDDKNLYVRNSTIITHMESVTNGLIMLDNNIGEGIIIENCKIYQENDTTNISLSNSMLGKYKNCEFNSKTQVILDRGEYRNCIFNNNPLVAKSGSRARMVELYNCVFNNINNDGTSMFQSLNTNDYYIIENCVFNYVSGDTSTRFVFSSGSGTYSATKPLIVKNSIFKGSVYANSSDISKGYVIGNYINNNTVGNLSANLLEKNNTIDFNY